jgi:hypothetical protein
MGVRKKAGWVLLEDFHLEGLPPALGLTDFKGDTVGLRESEKAVVRDVRPVKENIFDALGFNEPVLLLLIVPLHFAFEHFPPLSSNLQLAANLFIPKFPPIGILCLPPYAMYISLRCYEASPNSPYHNLQNR